MIAYIVSILALLICVALLVISCHPSRHPEILETSLHAFRPELLFEKNPIIISDEIVKPDEFLKTIQWLYVKKTERSPPKGRKPVRNPFAYLVFHGCDSIELAHPRQGTQRVVVNLHPHQILIVPYRWTYVWQGGGRAIGLDTLLTMVMNSSSVARVMG